MYLYSSYINGGIGNSFPIHHAFHLFVPVGHSRIQGIHILQHRPLYRRRIRRWGQWDNNRVRTLALTLTRCSFWSCQHLQSEWVLSVQWRAPIHISSSQPTENSSRKSLKQQRQMSTVQSKPPRMHLIPHGDSMLVQVDEEICSTSLHRWWKNIWTSWQQSKLWTLARHSDGRKVSMSPSPSRLSSIMPVGQTRTLVKCLNQTNENWHTLGMNLLVLSVKSFRGTSLVGSSHVSSLSWVNTGLVLMFAWKIGPGLATGNSIVLKPSEFTPLTTLRMCTFIQEVGFPPGSVNVITGYGNTAGNAITSHMKIEKVCLYFILWLVKSKPPSRSPSLVALSLDGKSWKQLQRVILRTSRLSLAENRRPSSSTTQILKRQSIGQLTVFCRCFFPLDV